MISMRILSWILSWILSGLDSRLDFGQDADLEFDIQVGSLNKRVHFWGGVGFGEAIGTDVVLSSPTQSSFEDLFSSCGRIQSLKYLSGNRPIESPFS